MNFLKVISFVLIGHGALFGSFLLLSGCKSIDEQWAEYRREKQLVQVPREVLAQEQGLPPDSDKIDPNLNAGIGAASAGAARVRSAPTRPAGGSAQVSTGIDTEPAEPLFNPGLTGGINAPLESSSPTSGYVPYTVERGDTLWGLSKEYNVPFAALLEANGMTRETQLKVGQEILVPSGYGEIAMEETMTVETLTVDGTSIYTVGPGDTLSEIAARAGTSVSRIRNLNNMTGDRIRIGQKLIVPGEIEVAEETVEVESVEFNASDYTAEHVVDSGETASGIAVRYGMTVDELLAVNGISNPRSLRAGTTLKVKPASTGAKGSGSGAGASRVILPSREPDEPGATPAEQVNAGASDEPGPLAPSIVPREPTLVESEAIDEEGFGAEIFEDFEGVEEVPVERRSNEQ